MTVSRHVCVSSREHNVFLNGFSSSNRTRLQDLTRTDLERYINAELKMPGQGEAKKKLVKQVLDKAHGIFVWVRLVVRYLTEQIEDGHSYDDLQKSLDGVPLEMENLFRHVLDSIGAHGSWLRARAYQILAIAKKIDELRDLSNLDGGGSMRGPFSFRLPLICLQFLQNYQKDTRFAMSGS